MAIRTRSRKGAPGILEVAKRANVSPATVSRAYNNPDLLKAPTLKRIREAAKDLGYIRDRMAGAMHNRSSGTIGLIVPTIDNAIFAEMIEAFSSRLQQSDRTMLIAAHGYDLEQEVAIVRSLLERRIDGIVLTGLDHDPVALNMLELRDVPVITLWNYDPDAALPCIGANNFEAGFQITNYVLENGHKDIAFVFPETGFNDRARERLEGAIFAMEDAGLSIKENRLLSCPYDIGEAKKLTINLLNENRPTAFVCCNDIIAHGVLFGCQANDISVPKDVSIAGIGDFRGSAYLEPALTTVRMPAKQIGTKAAETIIQMSEKGIKPNPKFQLVSASLVERKSVSKVPSTQ